MTEEVDWLGEKYIVVIHYEVEEVQHAVNEEIQRGYEIYGELTYADGRWYQVMTRK